MVDLFVEVEVDVRVVKSWLNLGSVAASASGSGCDDCGGGRCWGGDMDAARPELMAAWRRRLELLARLATDGRGEEGGGTGFDDEDDREWEAAESLISNCGDDGLCAEWCCCQRTVADGPDAYSRRAIALAHWSSKF